VSQPALVPRRTLATTIQTLAGPIAGQFPQIRIPRMPAWRRCQRIVVGCYWKPRAPRSVGFARLGDAHNDPATARGMSASGGAALRHPDRRLAEPRTAHDPTRRPADANPRPAIATARHAPMPPPGSPQAQMQPGPMVAPKKKRLGWTPLAALIGLIVGGALGGATNDTRGTASPTATVTVTAPQQQLRQQRSRRQSQPRAQSPPRRRSRSHKLSQPRACRSGSGQRS
jgi:hypothetical protein